MKYKFKLPWWSVILLILALSVISGLFSVGIQPGDYQQSIQDILDRDPLIYLNLFPILATIILAYFVSGNVFWGASVSSLIWLILSYINLLKIEGRDDALVPADIGLAKEALNAATSYSLNLHLGLLIGILLYCGVLLALGFFLKSPNPHYLIRIGSSVGVIGIFALMMIFVYPSKELYNSFPVPSQYNIPSVFNTLGFNYCFLHNANLYPVDKPEGYSKATVEQWAEEYTVPQVIPTVKPNIIMVMGEAFSDLSNDEVFDWQTEQDNPAYLYNHLTQSEQAISGHIVVSNIAAGTANTEFDILTGMPTTMVGEGTTSSFRVVHKSIPTVASALKEVGYETRFMHPGYSWFYNRSSVYRYFGIEQQTFNDAFDLEKDTIAGLVSDKAFLRQLKTEIEQGGYPQFIYSVTIQNHQAYNYAKYPDPTDPVPLKKEISEEGMEYLSVDLRGVQDTSEMLYELVDYLEQSDEPTLLIFFGDHLPNLGSDYLAYRELGLSVGQDGTPEEIFSSYETPFLIYANTAYCASTDFTAAKENLQLSNEALINNHYLGAMTLELAGFEGLDPYFDFLNDARRILPAFREGEKVYLSDNAFSDTVPNEICADIIGKIDWWEYYRLK